MAVRVAILGASGFVGKAVSLALRSRGHTVVACVRSVERARVLGADTEFFVHPSGVPDPGVLESCDAVINLVGSPLVGRRWTKRRLEEAEKSRVELTEKLVDALLSASPRPRVLVSVSAIGFYDDRPALSYPTLDESAPAGSGWLSRFCVRWEEAARGAEAFGVRVILPRLGVVLGRFGGILEVLEPAFRVGLGASLSWGAQPFSWIHIVDVCRAFMKFIEEGNIEGPVNVVSPEPVTYKEFVDALASQCGTRVRFSVPSFLVRLSLGEGADSLLAGQSAIPAKLRSAGFEFCFPRLEAALADLFDQVAITVSENVTLEEAFGGSLGAERALDSLPLELEAFCSEIPRAKRQRGLFLQSIFEVASPKKEVFKFYSIPANLQALMPPRMPFRVIDPPPRAEEGTVVSYETGRPPFSRRYRGRIFGIREPYEFYDSSLGPAPLVWFHRHRFEASRKGESRDDKGTSVADDVWFWVPAANKVWPLRYANRLGIPGARYLFEYRGQVTRWRFGASS